MSGRDHINEDYLTDLERQYVGHGHINGGNVKWLMGIMAALFVSILVAEMAWLGSTVVSLSGQVAAMDAKLSLLIEGRIKDPNVKP
jgi:hypothetical protein